LRIFRPVIQSLCWRLFDVEPHFFIRRRVTPELSLSVINTRGARPRFMSGLRISRRDACRSRRPYEWRALNCRVHRTTKTDERASPSLAQVVLWIAKLGGYLDASTTARRD
jgi:hypothetical protein